MILSRFFREIEVATPLIQQDELAQKTAVMNCLLILNQSRLFSKMTFACEQLRLEAKVEFFECEFPNLHLIEFAFASDRVYRPFDSCTFNFPLNLVYEAKMTVELPSTLRIFSVDASETPVELIQNGKTTTIDQVGWVVTEHNDTVRVKYGTETSSFLDHYSLLFYTKEVEFEQDPEVIMGPTTLIVKSAGHRLGQIKVTIEDHPFSLAILESKSSFINFNGSIPSHWSRNAHSSALERMKKIRGLSLLGGIGTEALTDLVLDLESLEVGGEISSCAFDRTSGLIEQLTVESLIKDSFKGSNLILDFVHLNTVEIGVKIDAKLISLTNSNQFHVVDDAKTLVIREKFDSVIDASDVGLTKIDFRTVTNSGPFFIQNFDHQNLTFLQPDVVYRPIYTTVKVPAGEDAYRAIVRRIVREYPEVKRLDQIEVNCGQTKVDCNSNIERDGLIEVKLADSGVLIGRFAVHIDATYQYLFYGLWGMSLTLGVIMTLY